MKRILFITPADARFGFRLTGVAQVYADADSITTAMDKAMAEEDVFLIIVDERLYFHIDVAALERIERHWAGSVIVLPGPEKIAETSVDYLTQLITRAIGYHVRLQA